MKFNGVVSAHFPENGYGFITENRNGRAIRYFFHITNILSGEPKVGLPASFDFIQTSKGLAAINVEFGGAQ